MPRSAADAERLLEALAVGVERGGAVLGGVVDAGADDDGALRVDACGARHDRRCGRGAARHALRPLWQLWQTRYFLSQLHAHRVALQASQ